MAADIDFREALGFEASAAFVRDLYSHPEKTTGTRDDGLLMTEEEAQELSIRLSLEGDAEAIEQELSKRPDWAGVAIDNLAGGKLVLMLVGAVDAPKLPHLVHAERVEVRSADFTYASLEAETNFLWKAKANGQPFMADVTSVSTDVLKNRVVVELYQSQEPTSFRAEGWLGADAVEVVSSDKKTQPLSLHCDSTAPPVYGGVAWAFRNSAGCSEEWCTVGFEMQRDNYPGKDWILTAGHCATTPGQSLYHWATSFAWWRLDINAGSQDFGLMEAKTTAGSISKVYWSGAKRQVSGSSNSYPQGAVRCQTGWKTGYSVCGTILSADSSCGTHTSFVKTTADGREGDSGGPVYIKPSGPSYYVTANGIISCGALDPSGFTDYTWYPKWGNIPSSWGVHISSQ